MATWRRVILFARLPSISSTLYTTAKHTSIPELSAVEHKENLVIMAEDKEELNIKQPEPTEQSEEATPDPSAPPEKKGSTIGITPCLPSSAIPS